MGKVTVSPRNNKQIVIPLIMALGNHVVKEIGLVEKINETVRWDPSQWEVSPGQLAKAMILASLTDMRAPLTHMSKRFVGLDTEYLFGEGIGEEAINEYNLGQMLDRLSEQDCNALYRSIALSISTIYQTAVNRLHADTTTISFYGEYDIDLERLSQAEQEEILKITRGYNKDGKPQCNQVVVGQIVNEEGLVLASDVMDGNTSDIDWNRRAIEYAREIQQTLSSTGVFVADSKLVCAEHFKNLMDPLNRVLFVSRCPANFANKLESRLIEKAYARNEWQELGQYRENSKASQYEGVACSEELYGYDCRLLVVRSSSLAGKAEQQLEKEKEQATEAIRELEKKTFKCLPDVEAEWQRFLKLRVCRLFAFEREIITETVEKWPRGRRRPDAKPIGVDTSYRIQVTALTESPAAEHFRHNESCFVLIGNLGEETTDREFLGIYKGQQIVENSFMILKKPCLASVIYLKNENRIRALTMILSLGLMVRAILQYRMRQGLAVYQKENPGKALKAGWGTKKLTAPTFQLLFEYSRNHYYLKTGPDEYSFCFDSDENEVRLTILLSLMNLTVSDLI